MQTLHLLLQSYRVVNNTVLGIHQVLRRNNTQDLSYSLKLHRLCTRAEGTGGELAAFMEDEPLLAGSEGWHSGIWWESLPGGERSELMRFRALL